MSAQLAQLQEDREQYQEQLDLVAGSLQDDPENAELQALKEELESALAIIDDSIADLNPTKHASPPPTSGKGATPSASSAPSAAAHSSSSHDAPAFKVKDDVLARWVSGDKAFYPARIMSVTGSATAPMYTVKFKSYNAIETLRAHEIRPLGGHGGTKRKAETAAGADSSARTSSRTPDTPKAATGPLPPPPPQSQSPPPHAQHAPQPPSPPPQASSAAPPPPPPPPSSAPAIAAAAVTETPPPPPPPPPPSAPASAPTSFTPAAPPIVGRRTIDRFNAGIVSSGAVQLYPQAALLQGNGGAASGGFKKMAPAGASSTGAAAGSAAGSADEPPPKKFKKIKATKQLEAGKSKWQDFNKSKFAKGGTSSKKESMFRTPEGVNGRVGFVGAGKTERKDLTRSRHIYQTNDDLD